MERTTGRLAAAGVLMRGALRAAQQLARVARRWAGRAAARHAPAAPCGARMAAAAPAVRRAPVPRPCAVPAAVPRPVAPATVCEAHRHAPASSSTRRGRPPRVPGWQAPLWDLGAGDGAQLALMPDPRHVVDVTGTAWEPRPRLELVRAAAGAKPAAPAPGSVAAEPGPVVDRPAHEDDTPDRESMPPTSGVSREVGGVDAPDRGVTDRPDSGSRHRGTGNVYSLGTRRAHQRHTDKEGT